MKKKKQQKKDQTARKKSECLNERKAEGEREEK